MLVIHGVSRQMTETILLRCSAAVELGLSSLPQGRCSFGFGPYRLRAETTGFPESGRARSLGERPWSALRSRCCLALLVFSVLRMVVIF